MNINIGQLLSYRAQNFPQYEAAVDLYHKTRYNYVQYNQRVNQLVHWFSSQGIVAKDRVAMICKNSSDLATIFYAAAKAGIISIPLNWRLHVKQFIYILQDSQPKVIFYDDAFDEQVVQLKTMEWAFDITFIRVGKSKRFSVDPSFESILEGQPRDEPEIQQSGEDEVTIIYTSGTTGKPKGVLLSHENIWSNAIGVTSFLDWRSGDRFLSVAPMFHIGGLVLDIVSLLQRTTVIYMNEFHPQSIWEVIEQEQITQFLSVPSMLQFMLETINWLTKDLDSLRYILCGASAVPCELIEKYNFYGIPMVQVYGCTEYAGAITFWTQEIGLHKHDTMGKPLFHTEIKIVEPGTTKELPTGQIGEIICKGPCIFKGYWNQPESKKTVLNDWYYTGDLGKIDPEGFLKVIDRYQDMLIIGGENIYPAEIESVLQNMEGIQEAAVIGGPHPKFGEALKIYIVKSPESTITTKEVSKYCQDQLTKFKCKKDIEFIEELPKNAVGQVLKRELRKRALRKQL